MLSLAELGADVEPAQVTRGHRGSPGAGPRKCVARSLLPSTPKADLS